MKASSSTTLAVHVGVSEERKYQTVAHMSIFEISQEYIFQNQYEQQCRS